MLTSIVVHTLDTLAGSLLVASGAVMGTLALTTAELDNAYTVIKIVALIAGGLFILARLIWKASAQFKNLQQVSQDVKEIKRRCTHCQDSE